MSLKAKLEQQVQMELNQNTITNNETVQLIIQRTFLWLGWITAIVFSVWYYIVGLIKSQAIVPSQYMIAFWVSAILWLWLVFAITWFYSKMSYTTLAILAILFALAEWVWLAGILAAYSVASVINAFAGAALLFIIMAIYGYTTKADLTKLWTILLVWLITIIVLSLVNMFLLHSSWFDLIISIVAILIFLWLVAFDLQMLKNMATTWDRRIEIVFWIGLYLDFINIFLELLQIFYSSDD